MWFRQGWINEKFCIFFSSFSLREKCGKPKFFSGTRRTSFPLCFQNRSPPGRKGHAQTPFAPPRFQSWGNPKKDYRRISSHIQYLPRSKTGHRGKKGKCPVFPPLPSRPCCFHFVWGVRHSPYYSIQIVFKILFGTRVSPRFSSHCTLNIWEAHSTPEQSLPGRPSPLTPQGEGGRGGGCS